MGTRKETVNFQYRIESINQTGQLLATTKLMTYNAMKSQAPTPTARRRVKYQAISTFPDRALSLSG